MKTPAKQFGARRGGALDALLGRFWELRPEMREHPSDTIRLALSLAILYLEAQGNPPDISLDSPQVVENQENHPPAPLEQNDSALGDFF